MEIKVTTSFPNEPIIRQTPQSSGRWRDSIFLVDSNCHECDFWAVCTDLLRPETVLCRAGHTILVTMEPPESKPYHPSFLRQFDLVLTSYRGLVHPNIKNDCQGLPWHAGLNRGAKGLHGDEGFRCDIDYDMFVSMRVPKKVGLLSTICSSSTALAGHLKRREFVKRLKAKLGDRLALFGRGVHPVGDKWEAIAPFKYHLVLENSAVADYWSEKLADCYLAFAYPIYWGAPNVLDYFPSQAITPIEITDSDQALAKIDQVVQGEFFEKYFDEILTARKLVLEKYNTFEVLLNACLTLGTHKPKRVCLKPNHFFGRWRPVRVWNGLTFRARRFLGSGKRNRA